MFFNENKKKSLHNNRVQFPEDLVEAPTWPPFLCLGAPTWRSWRHVKTENCMALLFTRARREIREKLSVFTVVLYNYILENMLSFNMHTLFRFFWQQTTRNTSFFERKFYVAFYDALSYTQMRLRSRTLRPSLSSQLDWTIGFKKLSPSYNNSGQFNKTFFTLKTKGCQKF